MTPKNIANRRVAGDFKAAAQLALAGNWVDISPLLPVSEGKHKRSQEHFQESVQWTFDVLTETATSSEYAEFLKTAEPEIAHLTGLTVVSDLEFVLVFRCDNEMYGEYFAETPQYIYLPDPYVCHVYQTLLKRGNKFVFWTSAVRFILKAINAVLPEDLADTPAICREDFLKMIEVFMKRVKKEIPDRKAKQELKRVFPSFTEAAYEHGLKFFSEQEFLLKLDKEQKLRYAVRNKFPILLAAPETGVFIDDNLDNINSAVSARWPKERTIHLDPGIFSLRRGRELIEGLRRVALSK
jgi:hypothetical protein